MSSEKDLPGVGLRTSAGEYRRFWRRRRLTNLRGEFAGNRFVFPHSLPIRDTRPSASVSENPTLVRRRGSEPYHGRKQLYLDQ